MAKSGTTAETAPYKAPAGMSQHEEEASTSTGSRPQRASYTPGGTVDPMAYGRDGGRANAQGGSVPSVVVGRSSEVAPLPAMPGTLRIGELKNVSTPVSGG